MLSVIILHTAAVRCPISVVIWIICRVSVDHFLFLLTPGCYQYFRLSHWPTLNSSRHSLARLSEAGMTLSALTSSPISRSPIIKGYFLTYTPVIPGLFQQTAIRIDVAYPKNSSSVDPFQGRFSFRFYFPRYAEYWVLTVRIIKPRISDRLGAWEQSYINGILRSTGFGNLDWETMENVTSKAVMWWSLSQSMHCLVNYNRALLSSIVRILWIHANYSEPSIRLFNLRLITLLAKPRPDIFTF